MIKLKIYIDADACPVVSIIEDIAYSKGIDCIIVCDHNHLIRSDYSEVIMVDTGNDSADLEIINRIEVNDILVSQDYGLATLALSKSAVVLNHFGKEYTHDNIDQLLAIRHLNQKLRMSNKRVKGPKKRTVEDDIQFEESFLSILERMI